MRWSYLRLPVGNNAKTCEAVKYPLGESNPCFQDENLMS